MKEKMKQKYVPCQLDVVEFNVERGFAGSMEVTHANNMINGWVMSHNDNRNEQYSFLDQTQDWVDEHSL